MHSSGFWRHARGELDWHKAQSLSRLRADDVRVSLRDDATRRSSNCSLANGKDIFTFRRLIRQTARRRLI